MFRQGIKSEFYNEFSKAWVIFPDSKKKAGVVSMLLKPFLGGFAQDSNLSLPKALALFKNLHKYQQFIDYKKFEAKIEFGVALSEIYSAAKTIKFLGSAFQASNPYREFSESIAYSYLEDANVIKRINSFNVENLKSKFVKRSFRQTKTIIAQDKLDIEVFLKNSFPKELDKFFNFIELCYHLNEFIDWKSLLMYFGEFQNSEFILDRQKKPVALKLIFHYLVELAYLLSEFRINKFDIKQLDIYIQNFCNKKAESGEGVSTDTFISTLIPNFNALVSNINTLMNTKLLFVMIRLVVERSDYNIEGELLRNNNAKNIFLKNMFEKLQANINLYYDYRTTDMSIKMIEDQFSVKYEDLLENISIYNDKKKVFLMKRGIKAFHFSVLSSIVYFYFKLIYSEYMKVYLLALTNNVYYVDKLISIKLNEIINKMEMTLVKFVHYLSQGLTTETKEGLFLQQFLTSEDSSELASNVEFRAKTVDAVVKKHLLAVFTFIVQLSLEIKEIQSDISDNKGALVIKGSKLPIIQNEDFNKMTKVILGDFTVLIEISSYFLDKIPEPDVLTRNFKRGT